MVHFGNGLKHVLIVVDCICWLNIVFGSPEPRAPGEIL